MKRVLSFLLIVLVLGGIGYYFISNRSAGGELRQHDGALTHSPSENPEADTKNVPLPVKLTIPTLGISAAIEYVGMDEKGNMDVPKKNENVAWFELGYRPGVPGNSVIAGHLDTKTGAPAVFYHLEELKTGDMIQVVREDGTMLEFTVTGKETYPIDEFPLNDVFGPSEKPRLNLITCEGAFNSASRSYSHRTVVFSELAP